MCGLRDRRNPRLNNTRTLGQRDLGYVVRHSSHGPQVLDSINRLRAARIVPVD